jgi:UDP-glucuronate decarboxylase
MLRGMHEQRLVCGLSLDGEMHLERRVLITGGAGFLGSHLCERLLAGSRALRLLFCWSTTEHRTPDHSSSFRIDHHDVTFPLYVEVDQIYNLACPASPIHYQHDLVQTTKTSCMFYQYAGTC